MRLADEKNKVLALIYLSYADPFPPSSKWKPPLKVSVPPGGAAGSFRASPPSGDGDLELCVGRHVRVSTRYGIANHLQPSQWCP